MQTYVLYHANCPDGFGAAWAAWMALGSADVNYLPCAYGRPLPAIDPELALPPEIKRRRKQPALAAA